MIKDKSMKTLLIAGTILLLSQFVCAQSEGDTERSYDKFKDSTTISGKTNALIFTAGSSVTVAEVLMSTTFSGQKMPANPQFTLSLLAVSDSWQFLRTDLALRALVNGNRVTLGIMKRADSSVSGGNVSEVLVLPVMLKTLEDLGNANTLEMKVASVEISLKPNDIQMFKRFVDVIKEEIPTAPQAAPSKLRTKKRRP